MHCLIIKYFYLPFHSMLITPLFLCFLAASPITLTKNILRQRFVFFSCLLLLLLPPRSLLAEQSVRWEGTISITSVQETELLRGNKCVQEREDQIQVRLEEGPRVVIGQNGSVYRSELINTDSTLTTTVKGNCVHSAPVCDCKEGLGNCKQNIRSATIQGTGAGQISLSGNIQYGSEDSRFPDGMFNLSAPVSATTINSGVLQVDMERCYDQRQTTWPIAGTPAFSIGGNPTLQNIPLIDKQTRSLASGSSNGSYSYTVQHGRQGNSHSEVIVRWSLHRKLDLECELLEIDKSWRPRHIVYDKQAEPALVTAKIVKPEDASGLFRFTLFDVSKELGAALNYGDESTEDLNFSLDQNNSPQQNFAQAGATNEGLTVESSVEKNQATVKVAAWDSGGWGRIKAEVDIGGMLVTCTPAEGNVTYVNIPRDDNDNHIADSWEEEYGVNGQAAESDLDDKPHGLENGDGLSNYEEYRGFFISDSNSWISTNPKIKDIFINDEIGQGVGPFTGTGLTVHLINARQYNGNESRLINFNTGYAAARPVRGQHGLWLHHCELDQGTAGLVIPYIGSPNLVQEVCVDTNQSDSVAELLQTVAHELGHGVNLHHPGPALKLINCDGIEGHGINVRPQNGVTSGNTDNIMRYASGIWFEGKDGKCYEYPDYDSEGNQFVDSTQGTGINGGSNRKDADNTPLPLTGDAAWQETTINNMSLLNETPAEMNL